MAKHTTLAQFEFFVLLSIERLGSNAFASEVRRAIEEGADRPTALGAIYATLNRLEEKGLVAHRTKAPSPVRGGRGRKLFALTPLGRAELERTEQAVLGMISLRRDEHGA